MPASPPVILMQRFWLKSGRTGPQTTVTNRDLSYCLCVFWASLVAQLRKNLPAIQETWVQSLGWEHPLERGTATHSSILAWRIPWTVESMRSQRVGHDWATFTLCVLKRWKGLHYEITWHFSCFHQTDQSWFIIFLEMTSLSGSLKVLLTVLLPSFK